MQKKKPQLKLNSYKLDTNALQSSLKELSQMRSQLETTISYYKEHEDQLLLENERLKQQIAMQMDHIQISLQKKTIEKPDHSACIEKISMIENQIKELKKQYDITKLKLERQQKKKKLLVEQYQTKLQKCIIQNQSSVDRYEQQIAALNVQLKQSKNTISSKTKKQKNNLLNNQNTKMQNKNGTEKQKQKYKHNIKSQPSNQYLQTNEKNQQAEENIFSYSSNSAGQKFDQKQSDRKDNQQLQTEKQQSKKKPKNPPPKSPNSGQKPSHSSHQIYQSYPLPEDDDGQNFYYIRTSSHLPNDQDQQIFQALIRKLLTQIKSLGITATQTSALPQFKKMSANKSPSWKDLHLFIKNPPISEQNDKKIQKCLSYLENTLCEQRGELSGKFVTELIIKKLEQYEQLQKLNTEELSISEMTPSEKSMRKNKNIQQNNFNQIDGQKDIDQSRTLHDYLNVQSVKQLYQ